MRTKRWVALAAALMVSAASALAWVKPGGVPWHASSKDALAASAKSGKPVFLFLLLGKLDEEFC